MDKNMINIDDLLKQRLTGGEEKERPGAWLQMQDLLNKEMPVSRVPVAIFNWQRMFGYLGALLLITAVSIGGYQMATSDKAENDAYNNMVKDMPNKEGFTRNTNNPKNDNNIIVDNKLGDTYNPNRGKKKDRIADGSLPNTDQSVAANANTVNSITEPQTTENEKFSQTTTKNNKSKSVVAKGKLLNDSRKDALVASVNDDNTKAAVLNTTTNNNNKTQQNTTNTTERQFSSSAGTSSVGNKAAATANEPKSLSGTTKEDVKADLPAKSAKDNKPANEFASSANNAKKQLAATKNNKKAGSGNTAPDYLVSKQVVPRIEVRETYDRKLGWKKDTTTGQAEMEILTLAEKQPIQDVEKRIAGNMDKTSEYPKPAKRNRPLITVTEENDAAAEVVPASGMALTTSTLSNEKLLPLSNFKVASKQNANYARTNLIEQMVQNAKVSIGNAKFYGGVVGGLNTSLSGNNSMWGFQLGLTGTLSLNERWGIVSELKYLHRFNSNALRNDGYANLNEGATINGVTTYAWDSVNRAFKFPTVSAMELPVYIRYSLNRLNFHAGMNVVYNFKINNIDVDSFGIHKINTEGPVVKGAVNYSLHDGVPRIAVEDFASMFSIGYLFGVGYQFTPAIQLDVRMTQSLWDNAKTDGAKEVSKNIYDVPSVQVNLSYRFGSNKFKPYHKN